MSPMITPIVSGLIYSAKRRTVLEAFPPGFRKLWKDWDLRVSVLISLIIQILLTILGNRRKYNGKFWIRALVWSAYTAADSVTAFALGIISNNLSDLLDDKDHGGPNMELTAVWAQFLFWHLGGPDSITAYALEDNELWKRQLLGLVSQTCGAIYVFLLAFTDRSLRLSILSILIFIAGFIKYGERTWTLKAASNQLHRKSVLKNPSIQNKGFSVLENVDADCNHDEDKLLVAYELLAATRCLFVDAPLMPKQSHNMQMVFKKLSAENAFQVNEIQLGMIYDLLYSKGLLLFSTKGLPLRVITFFTSCFSFVFFLAFFDHKNEYSKIDLSITFALLIVAVLLEIYAALVLLFSDWFFVWLAKKNIKILKTLSSFPPFRIPRWSNNIGQYTLLSFLHKEKPLLSCDLFLGTESCNQWNTQVDKDLRDLIFSYFKEKADELQSMAKISEMPFTALPITTNQEAKLQEQEEDLMLPDFIEEAEGQLNSTKEFEYKIVIWSIATEIMYYLDKDDIADFRPKCKAIKRIARYMLYLLVKHPSIISAQIDIMNPSFEDIIQSNFFRRVDDYVSRLSKTEICHKLLERFHNNQDLTSVGEIVIYKAMKIVAKRKAAQEPELSLKWKEVGNFWLEMLAYSANICTVNNHAQKLRYGGEFLTHVWLLMAHFGLTHHHFQSTMIERLKFITTTYLGNDWNAVEKRFEEITRFTDGLLHYSMFGECIGMDDNSKLFASELFWAIARQHQINSDNINKEQLHLFWDQISDENFDSRLKTLIGMIDKDADGKITEYDIQEIITLSAITNKLSNIHQRAQEYAALIMEELDPHKDGYIKVEKLENLLPQAPRKSERVLRKEFRPTLENNLLRRWYQNVKYFPLNVWQKVWILMLWLGIVLGLFAYKFVQYRNKAVYGVMGNCVCIAKGAAETLKFNMALILLPVCRNTITWLRNETKLGGVVPFDNNLGFHMLIAVGVVIGVILHSGAHLTCGFPRLIHATEEEYKPMKPYFGEKQPQNYWWFVKGVEGVTGIIMVVLMAIAFTLASPSFRRNKLNMPKPLKKLSGFNAFWYSHHLFVIVYVLLVVHGICLYLTKAWYQKTTWMYLVVPVLLYICERLIRVFRSNIKAVKILKVAVYPGNVLALHVTKPAGFKFVSGQYMFINCAAVSPFEWHPFSITSAPGNDYLSVHIRTFGDWTYQLRTVFSEVCQPPDTSGSGLLREEGINIRLPRILIDGPYGATTQDYKIYDVVLLIGLGIGATPMISIVQDIINNIQTNENNLESALENGNYTATPTFRTKKAYFHWVTREQQSFDWFKWIINEVAEMDVRGVIELHNYSTSVYEEGDVRSAMISVLQSLLDAKMGVYVVSETRVKSRFGKPNWHQVFEDIASRHANTKMGVFYCGLPVLAKELKQIALEFSLNTSSEFEFHNASYY